MKLTVRITQPDTGSRGDRGRLAEMVVNVGEGMQSVRWLSLVVAQRFLEGAKPHGRGRCRERDRVASGASLNPADVLDPTGQDSLDPRTRLRTVFGDGDVVRVRMGGSFGERWLPARRVNAIGSPASTRFHQHAFHNSPPARRLRGASLSAGTGCNRALDDDEQQPPPAAAGGAAMGRAAAAPAGRAPREGNGAAQLGHKNPFALQNEDERRKGTEQTVLHELQRMKLLEVEPDPDEQGRIHVILARHFPDLNALFKHYAGFNSHGSSAAMSFTEFAHFADHSNLIDQSDKAARAKLQKVFRAAAAAQQQQQQQQQQRKGGKGGNPEHEHLRFEFLEALLRLAAGRWPDLSSSAALTRMLEELVMPALLRRMEAPAVATLAEERTQALLCDAMPKMLPVYRRYALSDKHGHTRPTISFDEFAELLRDAGLMDASQVDEGTAGAAEQQTRFTLRDARVAFGAVQADFAEGDADATGALCRDEELVYTEFIEAVARVALAKWELQQHLGKRDKLMLAVDLICVLAADKNPKLVSAKPAPARDYFSADAKLADARAGVTKSMPSPLARAGQSYITKSTRSILAGEPVAPLDLQELLR